ncbi:Carboxylic ester hydrolase [Mycena kentingensis (nom. inval.)]|nr:Carboxylic ester hydrolase [Mycena kentingensis (nom. inval.)]
MNSDVQPQMATPGARSATVHTGGAVVSSTSVNSVEELAVSEKEYAKVLSAAKLGGGDIVEEMKVRGRMVVVHRKAGHRSPRTAMQLPLQLALGLSFSSLFGSWLPPNPHETRCLALKRHLDLENTTVTRVSYLAAGTVVPAPGSWPPNVTVTAQLCRVEFTVQTTESSSLRAEAWLPDEWYGRFLGLGNGGLGGVIQYAGLSYGSSLHFASVASNNGHDGDQGRPFLHQPEVINDFAFRSIHVEAVIGKQIVEAYYGRAHDKAYYLGCSTGGRQGIQTALKYPTDFDGILAGAPAINFNRLLYWTGACAQANGAPVESPSSWAENIPLQTWQGLVADEVLRQCDALDGRVDGLIGEPDDCDFRPEALLCESDDAADCLTARQVDTLRTIYSPLYVDDEFIYSRFDPGAEADAGSGFLLSGQFPVYPQDWLRYVVLNDTTFDPRNFNKTHLRLMEEVNPGGISTYDGNLSAFRSRGGKLLTYHGRMDSLIASGISKRYYTLVSETLSAAHSPISEFYRLFLVPGMGHCSGGPGAASFGQVGGAVASGARNDSAHNILLALVNWVEGGVAPVEIVGTNDQDGTTRRHCSYPAKSIWDGEEWICKLGD